MDWDYELYRHHGPLGLPFHFWTFFAFVFGATAGSFLNVVIHRMPRGESVVTPPSHCPKCGRGIRLVENLPIFSWILLRGRCRGCGLPISPRYLVVEALTGLLFVAAWLRFSPDQPGAAVGAAILLAGFLAATVIDFEHFIIPDEITLGGVVAGFLLSLLGPGLHGQESLAGALRSSGLGIVVGAGSVYGVLRLGKLLFGREPVDIAPGTRVVFHDSGIRLPDRDLPFADIFYRDSDTIELAGKRVELSDRCFPEAKVRLSPSKLTVGETVLDPESEPFLAAEADELTLPREAMGLGDVKFMAAIGAFLGWKATLFSLMFSSVLGAVVGVTLIATGRQQWSGRLPYGPYIAAAATAWLFGASRWWDVLFGR